jgi:hypothetical protein
MGKWRWFDARYNTRMGGRKRRLRDSKDGAAEVAEVGDSCGLTAKVLLAIEEFVLDQQQQYYVCKRERSKVEWTMEGRRLNAGAQDDEELEKLRIS